MKISDLLYNNKPSISFEVFPPKTDTSFESVKHATEEIAKLQPAFMSVTYGAGGGTSKYTLDIARNIHDEIHVPTLAHLTCVSSSKETIHKRIEEFRNANIKNIMALRGDLTPELMNSDRNTWDYRYAVDLIHELKEYHDEFCIGGACYPEVHPESSSFEEDIQHLKEKVDAGCSFLTSQMFFENDLFYKFVYRCRTAGINVPIIPGIMPITSASQVEKSISLSGSYMPTRLKNIVNKFGNSPEAMKQAGINYATEQIIDIYANGFNHVHVYSMNKPDVAKAILNNISNMLG
ncbi:MAG: methylenetetrahydrofolate reductase [NAD(P)H] [Lachnospiraceae bacterium]|nr:methylenetetrahydrofolate reductase [NAD(P)H] [Lachnospiraceae bacterium]